jgi:hypothetical protein
VGVAFATRLTGPLAFRLDGSVAVPTSRPSFALADAGAVHRPAAAFATASGALALSF